MFFEGPFIRHCLRLPFQEVVHLGMEQINANYADITAQGDSEANEQTFLNCLRLVLVKNSYDLVAECGNA